MSENQPPISAPNRPSLKLNSHFNNYPLWKAKLRENCYKRVREDRTRLLWKMRLPTAQSFNEKNFIKSAFQDIVSDELKKIKDLPSNDSMKKSAAAAEPNDIIWEYDGLDSAYQGECEEILIEMQRIFYEDLRSEPTRKEPVNLVETWEDEEDEYLAHAVYEHMHLNDQASKQTWCPVCKQGELQENCQLIYCTACELRLSKDEQANLDILHHRLAEVHAEHFDRGCRLKPTFRIETSFGLTALYISCEGCNTFEVVI
ncbi:RPA-interacting protein [Melia azedarach]|uniref:RPA-interacting protein n=1 Tax=Melia azedarach TaxID=155640 RepID=A0ACC1Z3G0_MELAZ|nr:RPA-interacting protein [Melia azedarach]